MEEQESSEMVTLHYIDRLCITLIEGDRIHNRILLLQSLASLGLILLSGGLITITGSFAIGGFTLSLHPALIPIGGSVLVVILLFYSQSLQIYQRRMREQVRALYRSVGREVMGKNEGFLGLPSIVAMATTDIFETSWLRGLMEGLALLVAVIIILLLPFVALIAAWWRMIIIFGEQWWIWAIFLLLFLVGAACLAVSFRNSPRRMSHSH